LAKIAIELEQALAERRRDGTPGRTMERIMAHGDGWVVVDVLCTWGLADRPFEERHDYYTIAAVLAGSFHYRSSRGRGLMSSGSVLFGNAGQCFECGHQHGEGDRCVAFRYTQGYLEQLAADAGAKSTFAGFTTARLPAIDHLASFIVYAGAGALGVSAVPWDELAVSIAVCTMKLGADLPGGEPALPLNAEARVSRTVRAIDRHPDAALTLPTLATEAGLSPYHFLRTFQRVTGITPHRYVRRARLREAATRLATESAKVIDIALDSGFGDISNFNRAFRAEFGLSPCGFRRSLRIRETVPPGVL
jgi:AraC family transcriptional regulator